MPSRTARRQIDPDALRPLLVGQAGELGIPLPGRPVVDRLLQHLALLLRWNERLNLTAIRNPGEAVRRHLLESLEGSLLLAPDAEGLHVDLGSGNGFPALPLLLARPRLRGLLVESAGRKASFLRAVVRDTGLGGRVEVLERRVRSVDDLPQPVALLTLRAFGDPGRWVEGATRRERPSAILAWLARDTAAAIAERPGPAAVGWQVQRLRSHDAGALLVGAPRGSTMFHVEH
jgi:16S rRNA (guanine527-N7)-methyltransferase